MSSHAKELEVKRKIRKTWPEFLAQFGRLTEVQTAAIPKILMGKSTIVVSATASGKTEAVISPLVEQMIDHNS